MSLFDLVCEKRDGRRHSPGGLALLAGEAAGNGDERLLAAWLMAAYLNGLDEAETAALTLAMAESGERLDLSALPAPRVDKHSTGGVGDKTTIVVLPILAACGRKVVKMSGRGLGITGGTIDKLESVPGFRTGLAPEELLRQAGQIGLALTGQTPRLAPADKRLYALRDLTGTVASVPLITASILSKKIAGGADTVVLDVKCGSGAFMPAFAQAESLRRSLETVGAAAGLKVRSFVTDMDQPLGRAVGNALEVEEALATLRGGGPARFEELCCQLAGAALDGGAGEARRALQDGRAYAKAREWFEAQGADWAAVERGRWAPAPAVLEAASPAGGWVRRVDARAVGEAALALGAGRSGTGGEVDPRVGVEVLAEVGQRVEAGQPVFRCHARTEAEAGNACGRCLAGFEVSDAQVPARPPVLSLPSPS